MGISSFPCPSDDGIIPMLVFGTLSSLATLTNKVSSVLGVTSDQDSDDELPCSSTMKRVSIKRYGHKFPAVECCLCLCKFECGEEVSVLSCKHVFHRGCLDKWFGKQRTTCPLCRSIVA